MSVDQVNATNTCGACRHANSSESKFCASCGQSLFEHCSNCSKLVQLTQKFCGSCGHDLDAALTAKREQLENMLSQAVQYAKSNEHGLAISTLEKIVADTDYRLADTAKQAKQTLQKVRDLKQRVSSSANDLQQQAKQANESREPELVIRLLEPLPDQLLTDESRRILRESKLLVEEVGTLNNELAKAMKARDWILLGGLVSQLLSLVPDNQNYQQIAHKIESPLMAGARRNLADGKYDDALSQLDAVPVIARTVEHAALVGKVEGFRWIANQLEQEPFVTPSLGKLGVRFAKESDASQVKSTVTKLAKAIKQQPPGRNHFNPWKGSRESWMGAEYGVLGQLKKVGCSDELKPRLRKNAVRMHVAIGLALQGIGEARVTESFFQPKKGLLKSLGRKKALGCWGVDIGTTGMRAVLLMRNDESASVEIHDIYNAEFDTPLDRENVVSRESLIQDHVADFVSEKGLKDDEVSVWVNLPASDIVNRFVCLPPVKDKEVSKIIEQEIENQIPLDRNELSVVTWAAPLEEKSSEHVAIGRPTLLAAARSVAVERRIEAVKAGGLTPTGAQTAPIALANFAAFEFADDIALDDGVFSKSPPAVVLLDAGVDATSIAIVTCRSTSVYTFEIGGADLTGQVAKQTKSTLADSELMKQNPVTLDEPHVVFASFDQRLEQLRQRLQRVFSDSERKVHDFKATQVWCVGGGSLCHGWPRTVIGKQK